MSEMSAELEHRGAAYREKVANYEVFFQFIWVNKI